MFGWLSSTVVFASATNLRTKASSEASSARICLTTSRFSKPPAPRRVARYTIAIPPDASSRSSTYLPKSWGNTPRMHRSLLLAAALGCACTTLPGGEDVHLIRPHWAADSCVPVGTSRSFDLEALGDFPPSNDTSEHLEGGEALFVPGATRGAVMRAYDGFTRYQGVGASLGQDRDIDVSLWPMASPCMLNAAPAD